MKNNVYKIASYTLNMLVICSLCLANKLAFADENGSGFWLPGQYASGAALPPSPGFALTTLYYGYRGNSNVTVNGVNKNISATSQDFLLQPSYAFETKILGATPSIGLGFGPGNAYTGLNYMYGPVPLYSGNQTTKGMSDLYPVVNLYWSDKDKYHFMAYLTGNIPTGTYNKNNLANIGMGHAAIDAGGAYTYTNRDTMWEASATVGVTNNFTNTNTNYKSGVDSHLDWDISKGITRALSVGIAGYVYYQLTGDSGSGDYVGANKSRVLGIGPEIGYLVTPGGGDIPMTYLNIRGYHESWVQNRTQGTSVFAVLTFRWGDNGTHLFHPQNLVK